MAYDLLEALKRNMKLRHGIDSPTPAIGAAGSPVEVAVWWDNRGSLDVGSSVLTTAVWVPQDTITNGATNTIVFNLNKKKTPGLQPGPAAGPTVAAASTPAGQTSSVTPGTHRYAFTYVSASGETVASPNSGSVTMGAAGTQVINLTGVTVGPTGTTSRKVYRSNQGTTTPLYYVGMIPDNTTTTFTDYSVDVELAPSAPTGAQVASTPGNVDVGNHLYAVTLVNQQGEGALGTASGTVTVSAVSGGNGQVALTSVPVGAANTGTIARRVYRTLAGGSIYYFVGQINDNTTTTFTDNVSDVVAQYQVTGPTAPGDPAPPALGGANFNLASLTVAVNQVVTAFSPMAMTLTATTADLTLSPGDVLTFQITGGANVPALTGGRLWANLDRR
jgi:hypothetical protein